MTTAATFANTVEYQVLEERVNVRAEPSAISTSVRFAGKGEIVHVVKIENRWAQLLDGTYIFTDYIIRVSD